MNAEETIKAIREAIGACSLSENILITKEAAANIADLIESVQAQFTKLYTAHDKLFLAYCESQRRERAAVSNLKMANFCSQCRLLAAGECDGLHKRVHCYDWEWRGPQEAGEGKKG